jgi:hypothetical protein
VNDTLSSEQDRVAARAIVACAKAILAGKPTATSITFEGR